MAEETESQVEEEPHDFEDKELGEISNEPFESGINEPQKQIPVVEDQQVNVLPENEKEEKEQIPLTTEIKAKSSPRKRQPNERSSWGVESAAYKFETAGIFKPRVTIDAILFQPIEPVEDDFKILVKS
jgi:hypothetical protein